MKRPAAVLAIIGALVTAPRILAQQQPDTGDRPLTTTYTAGFIRDLPTNDSLFTLIDGLQPSVISDRFSAGGLSTGDPSRLGGFLSSWTQTLFRIDGVPITDPRGNGAPLFVPDLSLWDAVRVRTGLFDINTSATGLAIDLSPLAPSSDRWTRRVDGSLSNGALASKGSTTTAPPVARLSGWDRGSLVASGPLVAERLAAAFGASWTSASEFAVTDRDAVSARSASATAHLVFTPNARDTIRTFGWLQQRKTPLDDRSILRLPQAQSTATTSHMQAVWEHGGAAGIPWRAFASYSGQRRASGINPSGNGITDRLTDGPVSEFASLSNGTVQTWSLGLDASQTRLIAGRAHRFTAALDATGGRSQATSFFSGTIGELVNQSPARVWLFKNPGTPSIRHATMVGGAIDDRAEITQSLSLEAGLRVQTDGGSADGATQGIRWNSLLPRFRVQWNTDAPFLENVFAGYSRSAYRVELDDLAIGDPSAPTADVYRWNALGGGTLPLSSRGALIAHAGPGTGGDAAFAAIDPALKTPLADELVIGADVRLHRSLLVRLTGVTRRERNLPGIVNIGAPTASSYAAFTVTSPGSDVQNPGDDRTLTVYNRLPSSFAQDRYLLTTPVQDDATFKGVELTIQWRTDKLLLTGGGTAGLARATAATLGEGPLANDQALLGDGSPNAASLASGRPFTDRAYTGKFAAVYSFPGRTRLGVIARYQDGQPFARVIVFPGLNQGAEAAREFANGDSRFTFVGTLDARLQRTMSINRRDVDVFVDAYNLLGASRSVLEDVAAAPDVRITTAVQPPRAIHIGARFAF